MSWNKALEIIDARIRLGSDIGSGSLRHWRRVIGKAYADFQVGFSGYGPAMLASLSLGVDGRIKGSTFPNMMLESERVHYGL